MNVGQREGDKYAARGPGVKPATSSELYVRCARPTMPPEHIKTLTLNDILIGYQLLIGHCIWLDLSDTSQQHCSVISEWRHLHSCISLPGRAAQYIVFFIIIAISTCAINKSQKTATPHLGSFELDERISVQNCTLKRSICSIEMLEISF